MPSFDLWQRQPPAACNTPAYCRYAGKHKVLHPADLKSACKLPRLLKKFFFVDIAPSSLRLCHSVSFAFLLARARPRSRCFVLSLPLTHASCLSLPRSLAPSPSDFLMISAYVPRPIALVSSCSAAGIANVAPYSYSGCVAHDPPTLVVSCCRRPDGRSRDVSLFDFVSVVFAHIQSGVHTVRAPINLFFAPTQFTQAQIPNAKNPHIVHFLPQSDD